MTGFVHVQVRFNTQFFPMTLVVGAETVPPLLMTDPSSREGSHFAPSHRAVRGGGGTCPWAWRTPGAQSVPHRVVETVSIQRV